MAETLLAVDELDKLAKLLLHQGSESLVHRHICGIERLCKSNSQGFAIRDLPKVQQVLGITLKLIASGQGHYTDHVCSIIRYVTEQGGQPSTDHRASNSISSHDVASPVSHKHLSIALLMIISPDSPNKVFIFTISASFSNPLQDLGKTLLEAQLNR